MDVNLVAGLHGYDRNALHVSCTADNDDSHNTKLKVSLISRVLVKKYQFNGKKIVSLRAVNPSELPAGAFVCAFGFKSPGLSYACGSVCAAR